MLTIPTIIAAIIGLYALAALGTGRNTNHNLWGD